MRMNGEMVEGHVLSVMIRKDNGEERELFYVGEEYVGTDYTVLTSNVNEASIHKDPISENLDDYYDLFNIKNEQGSFDRSNVVFLKNIKITRQTELKRDEPIILESRTFKLLTKDLNKNIKLNETKVGPLEQPMFTSDVKLGHILKFGRVVLSNGEDATLVFFDNCNGATNISVCGLTSGFSFGRLEVYGWIMPEKSIGINKTIGIKTVDFDSDITIESIEITFDIIL